MATGQSLSKKNYTLSNIAKSKDNKTKATVKVGNNYTLKITALSSTNLGLNEYTFGFPVLMGGLQEAKATLGDFVQVKILKIQKNKNAADASLGGTPTWQKTNKTYAIAKVIKSLSKIKTAKQSKGQAQSATELLGKTMEATVLKKAPKGAYLAEITGHSKTKVFIINSSEVAKPLNGLDLPLGEKVMVKVIRLKKDYAFAKLITKAAILKTKKSATAVIKVGQAPLGAWQGSKLTLVLPTKAKRYLKHLVMPISIPYETPTAQTEGVNVLKTMPIILFVKPIAGVKLGDKVQIQILKGFQTKNSNILIGKITEINPLSATHKKAMVKTTIKQMLNSGMHYGEKAIKCNPRMLKQNYVWMSLKKKGKKSSSSGFKKKTSFFLIKDSTMPKGLTKLPEGYGIALTEATQNKPLIKKGRNIINLLKTRRCLNKALAQLAKYAAKGKTFLFVGTKKAASGLIARASLFSKKAFFVNTRWLGGMLTNWKTIVKSISKIRPILKEKQLIIKDILQKRQSIKTLLMEKAFLLKKKSNFVLKKGRQLLQKFSSQGSLSSKSTINTAILEKTQKLTLKRKELVQKGQVLLEKRQLLLQKRKQVIAQSQALYSNFVSLTNNSKEFLNRATLLRKKLRELKALLFVSQQLQLLQQNAKKQNKDVYTLSYNASIALGDNLKQATNTEKPNDQLEVGQAPLGAPQQKANLPFVLPNPPKEILNKMVLFIRQNGVTIPSPYPPKGGKGLKKEASDISAGGRTSSAKKVYVLTQLLSGFSSFAPSIKTSIKALLTSLKKIQAKLSLAKNTLKGIVAKMENYFQLKNNILLQLRKIGQTFVAQRNVIRVVKRKLKQISAQKRLIQFLPKLRYLPTPSTKISLTVQVLMKKIVDPRLKYPMDYIYDQKLISQSKKVSSMRKKKWQRLEKYLGGISNMIAKPEGLGTLSNMAESNKLIRNNVAIIVGQQEEMNAVRECKKLGIKMFHIVDTNCNPGLADHFIPANDDSRNSIQYILTQFLTRIRLAQKLKKVNTSLA